MWIASSRSGFLFSFFIVATAVSSSPLLAQTTRARKALEKRLVVKPAANSKVQLNLLRVKTPFLTDRRYHILKLPRGIRSGTLIIRNSNEVEKWLPAKQLVAKKDCQVFVAIQTGRNREVRVPNDLVKQMNDSGWKATKGSFVTTSADKEIWTWAVFSRDVKEGPVDLKAPIGSRTAFIFMFAWK